MSGPTTTLVHGNHVLNTVYVTAERSDDFLATMGAAIGAKAGDVVCFGHTHVPWHRSVGGVHFVNAGSVGRPKDGDARAGYVLLDVGEGEPRVEVVRVAYDVECAARAIVASELPDDFAEYLKAGGRPSTPTHDRYAGAPPPLDAIEGGRAFVVEPGYTATLGLVIMGVATDARPPAAIAPFALGATVFAGAPVTGPLTGGSFNPARTLGPAVVGGIWTAHRLYWLAPIVGMAAAMHAYELLRPAGVPSRVPAGAATGVEGPLAIVHSTGEPESRGPGPSPEN